MVESLPAAAARDQDRRDDARGDQREDAKRDPLPAFLPKALHRGEILDDRRGATVVADRACRRRAPRARPARADSRDRLRRRRGRAVPGARVPLGAGARGRCLRGGGPRGRLAHRPRPRGAGRLQAGQASRASLSRRLLRPRRPGRRAACTRARSRGCCAPAATWSWSAGGAGWTGAWAAVASSRSRAARRRENASTSCASTPATSAARIGCRDAMRVDGMPLALLVNPASAHGRTLKLLPRLEQELDARRIPFRVERTRGLEDGVERALRAAEADEVPVVVSGDGLIGAIGGALAGSEVAAGDRARRARQRPGAGARHPHRPRGRRRDARRRARRAASTSARSTASASSASSASASTPKRTGSPTKPSGCAAISSTPTPACARWSAGSRPASRFASASSASASAATRSRSPTTRPSAAACSSPPTPT